MEKNQMSDEERAKLAAKLDKELDDYMNSLPKRTPGDSLSEESLEELLTHPFFMKEAPKPGDKLHPLMEGLQQLKYDPDQNSPQELAQSYKEDGNFNFKHKNYRLAIISYTEGVKVKCDDLDLHATLYYNRATAHFYLKNYRSSLRDCEMALKFKPKYEKALLRAIRCCLLTETYEKAIQFSSKVLDFFPQNEEVGELIKKANQGQQLKKRNERKQNLIERKQMETNNRLLDAINERGYHLEGKTNEDRLSNLQPNAIPIAGHKVRLDEEGRLVWPVVFSYPEHKICEYIEEFVEDDSFIDHLHRMFDEPAEWDQEKKYTANSINLYYENYLDQKLYKIPTDSSLTNALKRKGFMIKCGSPTFFLLPKNSEIEKLYTSK